jgi:hypothetical protein
MATVSTMWTVPLPEHAVNASADRPEINVLFKNFILRFLPNERFSWQ